MARLTPNVNPQSVASGFTLVELSIVLVILGILVGGVLAGQSLIHAAEIRSIITQQQRFVVASNSFRDQYQAMPGDMPNATAFWGKDNASCPANSGAVQSPGTCNGNGNGVMEYPAAANATGEPFRAWQQLALAGLIEGTFTGNAGSASAADPDFGKNSPATKNNAIGWGYGYSNNSTGASSYSFNYDMSNWLVLGSEDDNINADGPALSATDANSIDLKLDDGHPGTGKVLGNVIASCTTALNASDRQANYKFVPDLPNVCSLVFAF